MLIFQPYQISFNSLVTPFAWWLAAGLPSILFFLCLKSPFIWPYNGDLYPIDHMIILWVAKTFYYEKDPLFIMLTLHSCNGYLLYIAWTWNWSRTNLNFPCTVHPPLYEFEWSRDADINLQSKYLHLLKVFIFNVRSWEAFMNQLSEFQGWVL